MQSLETLLNIIKENEFYNDENVLNNCFEKTYSFLCKKLNKTDVDFISCYYGAITYGKNSKRIENCFVGVSEDSIYLCSTEGIFKFFKIIKKRDTDSYYKNSFALNSHVASLSMNDDKLMFSILFLSQKNMNSFLEVVFARKLDSSVLVDSSNQEKEETKNVRTMNLAKALLFSLINIFIPLFLLFGVANAVLMGALPFLVTEGKACYSFVSTGDYYFLYILFEIFVYAGMLPSLLWLLVVYDGFSGVRMSLSFGERDRLISFNGKDYRITKINNGYMISEASESAGFGLFLFVIRAIINTFAITIMFIRNIVVLLGSIFTKKGHEAIIVSGYCLDDYISHHKKWSLLVGICCTINLACFIVIILLITL